ncbi:MAG: GNAT family N-acetyltransferase [Bacteroidetes bacterium]|nr:GNAT family N-acetyltransferase [Bacteroidota bacterium]
MKSFKFLPFPELQTDRLLLRRLEIKDECEIFQLRSDKIVSKYLTRHLCKTMEEARAFIQKINVAIENNESVYWAICLKKDKKFIGTICLWNISWENERAEVGFELLPDFQKKGYMREALIKVLDFVFNTIHFHSIEGVVISGNQPSINILEKSHFIREGYFRENVFFNGTYLDTIVYSLMKPNKN